MSQHRTTETLRDMLMSAMDKVMDGTMESKDAKALADLSDRVIRSAELELKFALELAKSDLKNLDINPGPLLLTQEKA